MAQIVGSGSWEEKIGVQMCCAIYAICCLYFIVIPLDAKVLKFQIGSVKDCQKISRCIGSVFVGHLSPFGNPTARCFWCLSSAEYRSGCGKEGKDHNFLFLQPVVPSEKLNFSSLQGLACLRDARDLWGCFKSKYPAWPMSVLQLPEGGKSSFRTQSGSLRGYWPTTKTLKTRRKLNVYHEVLTSLTKHCCYWGEIPPETSFSQLQDFFY